jgi:hypothetical protein
MKTKALQVKVRNLVAKHNVHRGGVHQKTKKTQRVRVRQDLKRDYLPNCA